MFRVAAILGVVFGCAFSTHQAFAQTDRGTLTGTVSDRTGAVVSKAQIVITSLDTGEVSRVETTGAGDYSASNLPPGKYSLEVQAPGFRSFIQNGITLSVAVTTRQDVKLTIGAITEVVTVTSDASLLKTESAEQSTTISRETLNDLPIPFSTTGAIRDPLSFVKLAPGTYVAPGSNTAIRGERIA